MKTRLLMVLMLVACVTLSLQSQADDTKPSPTLAEAKAAYQRDDAELNKAYQEARAVMSEDAFKALQADERRWIRYRDFQSKLSVDPDFWREKDETSTAHLASRAAYWQAMASITQQRTRILQFMAASHRGEKLPLTGRWSDGYGGEINMVETPQGVAFKIQVVRGPTFHTGSLAGYAEPGDMSADIMAFSDGGETLSDGTRRKPAILILDRKTDRLSIHGVNTRYYCGARAYFDNDYYRIGDLTDAQRNRVLKTAGQSH